MRQTIDNKYYVTGIRNSLKPDVQMRVYDNVTCVTHLLNHNL